MVKSFKENVIKFWVEFAKQEAEFRNAIDSRKDPKELVHFIDKILSIAFNNPYFELGVDKNSKYELILTPEGDKLKLIQLEYWLKMVPKQLLDKWNFHSSKPAMKTMSLAMYGISIAPDSVSIYPEIDKEHQKVNLKVYSPTLMTLDENRRYSMFFIYTDQLISELYTMEYIGAIDFINSPKEANQLPVLALKEFIDETIKSLEWYEPQNLLRKYSLYKLKPSEAKDWTLREDIYIGTTLCTAILNSFYKKSNDIFVRFKEEGVIFGFIFFENKDTPNDKILPIRDEIENKILAQAQSAHIAESIGSATGTYFSYIDFIIYDITGFMKIAEDVLSQYTFEEAGFSNFIFGDKPYTVNPK